MIDELLNQVFCGECSELMAMLLPANSIDLTVTSPPYDDLRIYQGYNFDFEAIARQLFRVTKKGGVVVWVVGDATVNGSETGTSFRQALYFMELGFNLHDTMIYKKMTPHPPNVRYWQEFEYMFIISKGIPKTFNALQQPKCLNSLVRARGKFYSHTRNKKGELQTLSKAGHTRMKRSSENKLRIRSNVWEYQIGGGNIGDDLAHGHPAAFPEKLARDHILSWSNPNDVVLDPMCGSGTVPKMCVETGRHYIGMDVSEAYVALSKKRIEGAKTPLFVI